MSHFVKLYGSRLLGSSLMDESIEARWLFIVFLSAADADGFVRCQTTANAARMANLTIEQAQAALDVLSSPDPNSTTPDDDGRRIRRVEGGWQVVNYHLYREMRTESQRRKTERQRRWRNSKASTVDAVDASETHVDARKTEVSPSTSLSFVSMKEGVQGEGYADTRPDHERVRGTNFREASDLEVKILRAVRQISERTGRPAWEVCRQVTSYKRANGEMSAGVEDPARLGSILARQKALQDAEWWIGELDKTEAPHGSN